MIRSTRITLMMAAAAASTILAVSAVRADESVVPAAPLPPYQGPVQAVQPLYVPGGIIEVPSSIRPPMCPAPIIGPVQPLQGPGGIIEVPSSIKPPMCPAPIIGPVQPLYGPGGVEEQVLPVVKPFPGFTQPFFYGPGSVEPVGSSDSPLGHF